MWALRLIQIAVLGLLCSGCTATRDDHQETLHATEPSLVLHAASSTTKRIYFARHGLAVHNVEEPSHCHDSELFDAALVNEGSEQAIDLGKVIVAARVRVDVIVTSPLWRALQTSSLLYSAIHYHAYSSDTETHPPVVVVEDARERFSNCSADSRSQILRASQTFANFNYSGVRSSADPFRLNGGYVESSSEFDARIERFVRYLQHRPESHILVVTHGTFIQHVYRLASRLGLRTARERSLPIRVTAAAQETTIIQYCHVAVFDLQYEDDI